MKKKTIALFLILAMSLCTWTPVGQAEAASSFPAALTLRAGSIYTMRSDRLPSTGVKWTSSKGSVASISQSGVLTAKYPGTTTIKAKVSDEQSFYCKVTVKKKSGKKGSKYNPRTFPTKTPKGINFTYYMEGKKIGEFNIQITKFIYGEEAAKLALNNKSNAIPTADQQYLFFEVRLGYKSGTQTIKMSNVFDYNHNIFGAYGAKQLTPINWGYQMGANEVMSTVNISPGQTRTADAAILVENGFKPVTFRLQTGTNSYTWVKL